MRYAYFIMLAQAAAGQFAATFKDSPAIQKPDTFTIDEAISKMSDMASSGSH